ncbi:MAG: hypothetical protein QXJ74_08175 [Nitrososphaera sp.]|uniref:hypothetical protein n=2 Tax=Nitrososphaera sp. TaxID=1971748 RepID=UPI00185654D8|nr:hypothetical protein [Nitrososphaera sp.]NWG36157.1 hypothetical protein [Nitrososphaera sp.]
MSAIFRYYAISPWETETLYDTLKRSFEVKEEELRPDDTSYVSMVEISFPVMYGESFFQEFSMDSWHKVKEILKNMKRRRGKKGVKTYVRFAGFGDTPVPLVFPLLSKGDRQYEMGIEKLEYLVDIVPLQLKTVPAGAEEVLYSYDEATFKWSPAIALVKGVNYSFKNNEWLPPKK